MAGYDKSKEKVLASRELPFWDDRPEWGGAILEAVQYEDKQPKVVLKQYFVPKDSSEKKIIPFISIPASAVDMVTTEMDSMSEYIIKTYPIQKKNSDY
jgi:hypothetical protein